MTTPETPAASFGANSWLVEEMFEQFRSDPDSVSPTWREFFDDYKPLVQAPVVTVPSVPPAAGSAAATAAPVAVAGDEPGEPIRGAGVAIAANMERSLTVPTATSFRNIPAKLLEVNRSVINSYRIRSGQGKVSFTHLIGYAIVRAIADEVPNMNNSYAVGADGKPRLIRHPHVSMGLAVDVAKADGSRTLVVPVLRECDTLDFAGFLAAYEDLVRKVKTNKLAVSDFQGATISLTNPGTIGTVQSVPRLMPGQGVIVGVGSIDYPAEFQGADQRTLGALGVSKVVTVTSTYDHRIVQGAESGMFLKRVHELLLGEHGFYEDVFRSLDVPYASIEWQVDSSSLNSEQAMLHKQMQVATLIRVHRVRGHLIADLDPLRWQHPTMPPELDPATYGLTIWDLDREFLVGGVGGKERQTLGDLLDTLRDAYCRTIGVEYMHIQDTAEQRWIQSKVEGVKYEVTKERKRRVVERLNAAEAFEKFLATKYVGTKRFGLEGAESAIPVLDQVLSMAADAGLDSAVLGMAHRGRLNVLANIVGKSYDQIFKEFEGHVDPSSVQGSGDVKYHLGATGTYEGLRGESIRVELAANPSHLETVDPIVLGIVRAIQDGIDPPYSFPSLPILIHGDAAFAGQGIVAECLAMSDISGYRVGGTIHLIINNQIGFTTSPRHSRSSLYCSDVAKTVQAPIFHVNGDDPEACVRVAELSFEYRQKFHKDVVIDMVCYRRHGHNEGDDPSYTQPLMYKAIAERRSVRKLYVEALVKRGDITVDEAEGALADFQQKLQVSLDQARAEAPATVKVAKPPKPMGVRPHVETGVDRALLDSIFDHFTAYPDGFTPHPKLVRQFETRSKMYHEAGELEWAAAELLALGSLLSEGTPVRLAGEDSRRGTFSQRHAALVDYENEDVWIPLATLPTKKASMWVYDSLLSEYAALGFEYGYSHENKEALVMWEAQFGDFINGAQIIIDQYLVAAEDKWGQENSLVLLLPHGFEGQGPEHSSARIERFLTLCADDNIQVCNATTAGQYFHLLRRQVRREVRKPLVLFTPKAPLRMKESRSPVEALTHGSFEEVLDDPFITDRNAVQRVVFCSGKVAWDAISERGKRNAPVAIVRVEQLYPFPGDRMREVLASYSNAKQVVWLQEEPDNMGPWRFIEARFWKIKEQGYDLRVVSRIGSGSPATGTKAIHDQELADLMDDTFRDL
ncbi:MAG: multifunctional oxoglutarate decarboxylase/oxoglutarate dehydrogenase thiamine pyrophosphate-binding subunit/dihydrolipoyllysine-residue succinyltransferase subunit [Actinobacteria bacterium]|uniref:oxoglutarate dehydrogenase (succinyl-transferring) n=2 Tax=freshwater metagenome TaxID=449393 RepID=A0A6J7QAH5_9ZZZZ|nr:multifunctional oxoglutarate decarboxylase/oxoglutarate dehydrogenase thiamine pyrophosphate-binding subunit/dihydrolipoyllysine-residue succinyltransferase subunit [Actinomycetota bacterium]MSW76142.1 multifunctional oxoglutarate decarboxylase/oxoglutarate dehydrogenase thiamine pyrophosphate-binding subunit/dihydrolipoyllysine-residue succinyltransferase subunit [Actinomycetota bacterium]MSX54855.1 multifunctional oxoglutarate decarboxylase/oxoglutarate dehydrogenase thiamine pyrophosphate-b